eukprot:804181_1
MATLPSLIKVSRSDPVRTADHDVESRKKSLRFGSIFMRRNSLDRDDAIHRSASKEARGLHSRTTTNSQFRKQNSFYDISSSKELDSSDDSGDIVPIDYDDEQEEEEDEPKTKHRNEDILDGVDNIQKLFKKQKRVKFSQLDLSGDDPVAPTPSNARTRRSPPPQTRTGGATKGGTFGGQKRRQRKKTSQKNTRKVNRHVVASHKSHSDKTKENKTRVVVPKMNEQETQSVEIVYVESQRQEKEQDIMNDGIMFVSEYSDNHPFQLFYIV